MKLDPVVVQKGKQFPVISYEEFRKRKGYPNMTNSSISYNIEQNHLDFCQMGRFKYVVWNDKAEKFKLQLRRPMTAVGVT